MGKPDWTWLLIGVAIGYFVGPKLHSMAVKKAA